MLLLPLAMFRVQACGWVLFQAIQYILVSRAVMCRFLESSFEFMKAFNPFLLYHKENTFIAL